MIITDRQERTRFLRFVVVGTIGAIVDFGTLNLLVGVAHMPFLTSSVISFTAAVISNFLWNRFWTYPDSRSKAIGRQMAQFLIISGIGLGIRTPLLWVLEKVLVRSFGQILPKGFIIGSTFAGHNAALAVAVLVVMMWNFFANRFWTYNDVS